MFYCDFDTDACTWHAQIPCFSSPLQHISRSSPQRLVAPSPASMAASLSKIAVLRVQCSHYSRRTTLKHAISDQPAPPLNAANGLNSRPARFSRFKHDCRKPKVPEHSMASPSFQQLPLIRWYLRVVKSRPIATKSATAALIYTAADITSQVRACPSSNYMCTRGYVTPCAWCKYAMLLA